MRPIINIIQQQQQVMSQSQLIGSAMPQALGHPQMLTAQHIMQPQAQQQPPQVRERKILKIVNPVTGMDVLQGVIKERKQQQQNKQQSVLNSIALAAEASATPATKKIEIKDPNDVKVAPAVVLVKSEVAAVPTTPTTRVVEDTPTVSVNQDYPDEFLPHLKTSSVPAQKVEEPVPVVAPVVVEQPAPVPVVVAAPVKVVEAPQPEKGELSQICSLHLN